MSFALLFEQTLGALQLGVMLFLLAAGLTLVFGIMGLINLAHGSLYMIGAYVTAAAAGASGSFFIGLVAGLAAAAAAGVAIEVIALRRLYDRDHLHQVLATFGLILMANEGMVMIFGRQPLRVDLPTGLSASIQLLPGLYYPVYRLAIIAVGIAVALFLYFLIARTRLGMLIRAGSTHRTFVGGLGVNIQLLFTLVFGIGAMLAGLAGALAGPIYTVEVGMGETIIILTFVVIIIGGIGSIRGALIGAFLVAIVDSFGRAILPKLLLTFLPPAAASGIGAALASMSIYILMAVVLALRPRGLFPAAHA
ncbi:MAG: branched-chain amino acid ABC transporter permease [Candidatus Eiseniibacteriota bacterium]